jgi:Fe-S cluster biosynthesis and repair protein YggX
MVQCRKLNQELPGLPYAPIKGELGDRIYAEISEEAWKLWLKHSTMVINENRLNPAEPAAQDLLKREMEKFFFGEGVQAPAGYVPLKT